MDRKLVEDCYDRHRLGLYRYALSILKRPALAEDVLQETFLRLLTRWNPGLSPEKAQAWLYRVARNLCYDILRRQDEAYTQAVPIAPDEYAYLTLIAPLSPSEQELVTLKIVGKLTHREIGAVLGISAKTAQKRYERAIGKLREMEETR